MVFRLFLIKIKERGFADRMPVQPRVCKDPVKLHDLWWKKFTKNVPWDTMTLAAKQNHFRSWLFKKFSLDPQGRCMIPGVGSKRLRRNEAEWTDFWLTDLELDMLVKSVFEDYASQR